MTNARVSAADALLRLKEGNHRFAARVRGEGNQRSPRLVLTTVHEPFAIILGCSDARVPAELIFDQGLGDLFVIRVAGNIVAPSQLGSVEFAASQFGTRLVVVLGHSGCGAVAATIDELTRPIESRSPNLKAIVDRVRPAVETLVINNGAAGRESLMKAAVRANVAASVDRLINGSEVLDELRADGLVVVGAEYSIETGTVEFLE